MKYTNQPARRRWPKRIIILLISCSILIVAATIVVRFTYNQNLRPVGFNQTVQLITIKEGATINEIAKLLEEKKLIRSAWAFRLYVSSKEVRGALQAGSYELSPSQSTPDIISQLTHGKIATNLVTILPAKRIDQLRTRLVQDGFSEASVDKALDPKAYAGHPALVDKPESASLEGYIYPESYQRTADTDPTVIIAFALDEMNQKLTPELRSAFAKQGLSTYQAITLASIVEKEVSRQEDRDRVAQVFLKRLRMGMRLQSDATTSYGAALAGQKNTQDFDSPYNTYKHEGLPPSPVSNVTNSSLRAVAFPADTGWLYFVSGDDGTTHFSNTFDEHQANIDRYCQQLCTR